MLRSWLTILPLALCLNACVIDGLLIDHLSRQSHPLMPDPAPSTINGQVAELPKATVQVLGADGKAMTGLGTTAGDDGSFALVVDGATSLRNVIVTASLGRDQWLGILPFLPAQTSVLDPARTFALADLSPGMTEMGATSTALALLMVGRARLSGQGLGAVSSDALTATLMTVNDALLANGPALVTFAAMVARIGATPALAGDGTPLLPYDVAGKGSLLNLAFLQQGPVDYDGDGQPDTSTAAFDKALADAIATFAFQADCYPPDRIRVVLTSRIQKSAKNANCEDYLPFTWAPEGDGKRMFVTGGIHKDTPKCGPARSDHCLSAAQIDNANKALGNWAPNVVPMYDDGSNGDAVSGDGIWTASFDLPWWDPATAPDGSAVRIAYKFTYGTPKQGWTDSEEFPGNQRILELVDDNGDHVVTRFDLFADETSNKDKANMLSPAKGGCGVNTWPSVTAKGCSSDTHERAADLNGDCVIDGWPPPSPSGAITVPCPKG